MELRITAFNFMHTNGIKLTFNAAKCRAYYDGHNVGHNVGNIMNGIM